MKTVLVVDDSSFMRKYIKQILTQNDYDVIGEATNGEEAIEQYKTQCYYYGHSYG